jgi:two-component system response regulator NreC
MPRTTVVLADDHPLVRQGLRALLEAEGDFRVIGEAADGLKGVDRVERLRPSVRVRDVQMPGVTGLEITRQLTGRGLPPRGGILSMHASETLVLEALRQRAAGSVLKDADPAEGVAAVRAVGAGRRSLSRGLADRARDADAEKAHAGPPDAADTLTTRERDIRHLAAESASATALAARLGIGSRTVETHREHLMRKLGLPSQTALIRYALRRGSLPLQEGPPRPASVPCLTLEPLTALPATVSRP